VILDVPISAARCLHVHMMRENLAAKGGTVGERLLAGNFASMSTSMLHLGIFYMPQIRRLYFPSEGRRAEDFFALKNPDGFGQV